MKNIVLKCLIVTVLLGVAGGVAVAQDEGAALRVTFAWPNFIDPAVGDDFSSSTSLTQLYDSLIFPNAEGGVDPWLAESWEISDDGTVYTFNLRQDAQFHDGSELLASDVVYSFNRLVEIGEGYAFMMPAGTTVEALDDYTVQFTLANPNALFLPSLIRMYVLNEDLVRANTQPEGLYGENGDYGKDWLLTHDAGSGPYQVTNFPLAEFLEMERFDGWWNASSFHPDAPSRVRFIGTTEPATIRALLADGELEISDQWQPPENLRAIDEMEGVDIRLVPSLTSFYYMMNTTVAPLDDVHCRRAVSYAFDYGQAAELEWPGTPTMVGPVPRSVGGHNPNVTVYTRDLDRAREELSQCQYADTISDFPIEVTWIAEVPAEEKFALLFQANMAEIGVPVEVVSNPWLSVVENTTRQESSPDIVTIYVSSNLAEAGPMLQQRYHSSTANTWMQNEWLLDPALDTAIDDALNTVDQAERFQKYADLQAQIADLAPSLFLYDQLSKHAVVDYVDWNPEANSPIMGYQLYAAHIGVDAQ